MFELLFSFLSSFILPVVGWIGCNIVLILVYEWSSRVKNNDRGVGSSLF